MEIQKTTGIILSSRSAGEADVLCSILTREFGKRKFSFKGLKKSKRRSRSAADHGTILKLVYYYHENRDIHIVNEFHIDSDCTELRDDLNKIFHLCYLLEVTDKTTAFDDKNNYSFELLSAAIDTLKKTDFLTNL